MANVNDTDDRKTKLIRRIARIWSVPIILYSLMMLSGYTWNWLTTGVADPYAVEGYPFIEALPPILMFLAVLGLAIAWRWERLGGVINLVFLLGVIVLLLITRPLTDDFSRFVIPYLMTIVIAIPGILFLVCWRRSRETPAL
ncbi:MAG: hypothetical protein GQ562_01985 [Anaerolineales bacterium]|nr:hypothetical protein [Anaerolineales bacterium]